MEELATKVGDDRPGERERGLILLIGNPTSRGGDGVRRLKKASELMDHYGLDHVFCSTLPHRRIVSVVCDAIVNHGIRDVVCLGGDGTFAEAATGICLSGMAEQVHLGLLPSGTANDQGKSLGISAAFKDIDRNVRILAANHTDRLDVGEVFVVADDGSIIRRDFFFDSVGWGLSAAILAFRNRDLAAVRRVPVVRSMYRNHMVYVRAAMSELALSWLTHDVFTAEISVDGRVYNLHGLSDLVVSNTIVYAGEWTTDPEARHDDGMFEIVPFRGAADWTKRVVSQHKQVLRAVEKLGQSGAPQPLTLRGSRVRILILRPGKTKHLPAQLDGEEFMQSDAFEITVHPRMLNIVVPENTEWI